MTRIGNGPAEGLVEPIKEGFVFFRYDMGGGGGRAVWRENWLHDNKRCTEYHIGKYNNQSE